MPVGLLVVSAMKNFKILKLYSTYNMKHV